MTNRKHPDSFLPVDQTQPEVAQVFYLRMKNARDHIDGLFDNQSTGKIFKRKGRVGAAWYFGLVLGAFGSLSLSPLSHALPLPPPQPHLISNMRHVWYSLKQATKAWD